MLTTASGSFDLRPVTVASGAKYVAVTDSTTSFWNKGDRGTLVIKGSLEAGRSKKGGNRESVRRSVSGVHSGTLSLTVVGYTLIAVLASASAAALAIFLRGSPRRRHAKT